MLLLHILPRHIQHALVPWRCTVHQLLLQHTSVLPLRGCVVLVLQGLAIGAAVADGAVQTMDATASP